MHHHITEVDWLQTTKGDRRGFIQPEKLTELWFHTGTDCNLGCAFCLEGSAPGDERLEAIGLDEIKPFIKDALAVGAEQFSFTGGEPFVNPEIIPMLDYASTRRPCLVLTNGTDPLREQMKSVKELGDQPYPIKFRISLDHPEPENHDSRRGSGNFRKALDSLKIIYSLGFPISVARHSVTNENSEAINQKYRDLFIREGLPEDTGIVIFPELYCPGATVETPQITENCMTTYQTEATRAAFMCNYSKMIVKRNGHMAVYACTLVDDDLDYDLGEDLRESMRTTVMLRHHRCYACFSSGTSCSEKSA